MNKISRLFPVFLGLVLLGGMGFTPVSGQSGSLDLLSFDISGTIRDNYANLTYSWQYQNNGGSDYELAFRFGVDYNLFLSNVSIELTNETYYGQVKPVDEAQQEYEEGVESNKTAVLVNKDGDLYMVQLNLVANETATIQVYFEGYITRFVGIYELDLLKMVSKDHLPETMAIDIEIVSSTSSVVQTGISGIVGETQASIDYLSFTGRHITYADADYDFDGLGLSYRLTTAVAGGSLLTYNNGTDNFFNYFFAPEIYNQADAMDREYIFVIDVSGSMMGTRLQNAKTALMEMVSAMGSDDMFNVWAFSSEMYSVWTDPKSGSVANVDEAVDWVSELEVIASTNIDLVLEESLADFASDGLTAKALVFLSDGKPSSGETTEPAQIRENLINYNIWEVPIFSVSLGEQTEVDLMTSLATDTGGVYIQIDSDFEIIEAMQQFYDYFRIAVATGLSISYSNVEGGVYPTTISSEVFNGTEVLQAGKYSGDLNIEVQLNTVAGPVTYTSNAGTAGTDLPQVEKIWAVQYINALLAKNLISPQASDTKVIIDLALSYGLVVEGYTALVLVVEEPESNVEDPDEEDVIDYTDTTVTQTDNFAAPADPATVDRGGAETFADATPGFGLFVAGLGLVALVLVKRKKTTR